MAIYGITVGSQFADSEGVSSLCLPLHYLGAVSCEVRGFAGAILLSHSHSMCFSLETCIFSAGPPPIG